MMFIFTAMNQIVVVEIESTAFFVLRLIPLVMQDSTEVLHFAAVGVEELSPAIYNPELAVEHYW